jgi:phosphatidylserine decarboxylase
MYFITKANILISKLIWENLSENSQKSFCRFLSIVYRSKISKIAIPYFCNRYHLTEEKLLLFKPASGNIEYESFQDFFTRQLRKPLVVENEFSWPCEGYVCESGKFVELKEINVKGNTIQAREIFGKFKNEIEDQFSFANIFLHNHNYHRFHSPIKGTIEEIQFISGKLLFLRPWFYPRKKVSFPSFLNERVILKIKDQNQKPWLLSFVAGMGVGNIKLHSNIFEGSTINTGDEIGLFLLGSTCCMSIPYSIQHKKYMEQVIAGTKLPVL